MTRDHASQLIAENNAVTAPYAIERFGNMADPPETATYEVRGPGLDGGYVTSGLDQARRWALKFASVFLAGRRAEVTESLSHFNKAIAMAVCAGAD